MDSHQVCSTWRELGYCQTYPMTMAEENCLLSCNWCPGKLHLPAQTGRLRNYSRRFSVTPGLACSAWCPHTSCKPLPVGAFLPSKQTRALRNYSCRFSLTPALVSSAPCSHSQYVPAGSPSRGGDVAVYVCNINQPSFPTPFYSVLVSISVFMALSTVFHSIHSPDNSPFSHSVLPVLSLSFNPAVGSCGRRN